MRLSRLFAMAVVLGTASLATTISCGSSGSSKSPDAPNGSGSNIDAAKAIDAPPAVTNALGQLCPFAQGGGGTACPTGNNCVALNGLGSTTTGYCTPDCMAMNTICSTGYTGPAGGTPACALTTTAGGSADGCAIICTAATQCPTGMGCVLVPNQTQPVKICVPN